MHPQLRLLVAALGELVGEQPALLVRLPRVERGQAGGVERHRVDEHPLRVPGSGGEQHPVLLAGRRRRKNWRSPRQTGVPTNPAAISSSIRRGQRGPGGQVRGLAAATARPRRPASPWSPGWPGPPASDTGRPPEWPCRFSMSRGARRGGSPRARPRDGAAGRAGFSHEPHSKRSPARGPAAVAAPSRRFPFTSLFTWRARRRYVSRGRPVRLCLATALCAYLAHGASLPHQAGGARATGTAAQRDV